ncbi:MAG: hypothetical protein K8I00_10795, partial [Candidatus Omnitrophica bacterium]|nr:hypothetical protein [Candidatus Omnitrophota bacterium]
QQLQGEVYQDKLRRWQARLKDASASLSLPTDKPRPAVQTYNGAIARFQVEPGAVKDLENISRASSATLYMTLLAAFSAVISQLCREQDIVLSSPIAGRSHRETASMIGLFVNLLPLRIDLSGNPSFQDLLVRVRELCLAAQQDQDVTFDHILGALNVAHDPGRSPFSQVIFNVQHAPADHFEVAGLQFSPLEYEHDTANTDLAVILDQDDTGGISAVVEYNTDLFKEETILRIIGNFENVLAAVRQNPQNQLSGIYETCGLDATLCHQSQKEKDPFGYYLQHSNLTGHQLILWAGQQLDCANPIYNSTITYRMPEYIDIEHFRKAFQAVIDSRDSLRTVIQEVDGIPQRHVVGHLEYHVIYRDFSGEVDAVQAAGAWIERQSKTAYQLDQCLFRSALLKVADNDFIWYISQHHIITDGWSQVLTYNSVSQYYKESLSGDIQIKPVPQYEDYARHERDYLDSPRSQKDQAYWDDILAQKEDGLTFYGRQPVKESTAMCRLSHRMGEELTANIL